MIDVRIAELVVVGVAIDHPERLGPATEAAVAARLEGAAASDGDALAAHVAEAVADAIRERIGDIA
jgi:hypothetical protein